MDPLALLFGIFFSMLLIGTGWVLGYWIGHLRGQRAWMDWYSNMLRAKGFFDGPA